MLVHGNSLQRHSQVASAPLTIQYCTILEDGACAGCKPAIALQNQCTPLPMVPGEKVQCIGPATQAQAKLLIVSTTTDCGEFQSGQSYTLDSASPLRNNFWYTPNAESVLDPQT